MSQAENADNTSRLSRRTVLAGVSVAAAPVVAVLDKSLGAVAPLGPDAELLALNAQLDALWPELNAVQKASLSACNAADERCIVGSGSASAGG
jgi:hypothetical protein